MRGHEPLVPSSSGSPCIPRAELCPSGEGTGPGHPQLGRACSRPAARWVLRTCNHSSHERPVYSPLSSRALEMPSATAIPRDKDNGQQRDTTVIPAHPVVLPLQSQYTCQTQGIVCVGGGGVSVLLHSLDPSYSFSHGPAGCFSPASSPLPGAGPAWQQKQQRGLSSWTHGEERRPGCCRPLPRLKSPNSHPPATSGIQTLGEAENGTGRRERGERGLLSGTRWGAAPNLERKAGLGEELETLREATPHPSGCRVARRQAFQKNP